MTMEKRKGIRKKMFSAGGKIVWAPSDEAAKQKFNELLRLREAYRQAGGTFKK
jgi:hypothetical protein